MGKKESGNLILIGRVTRPHGLTGLLRIVSYAQSKETFLWAGSVFLESDRGELYETTVVSIIPHRSGFVLRLSGIESIDQAEIFRGAGIYLKKDMLKKEDEEEFFWHELIGMSVYLEKGGYLGVLKRIFSTGSNDVYVVENREKEFLVPAIYEVVKKIDLDHRKMIISPMKGLLDL